MNIEGGARVENITQGIFANVGIQRNFIITSIDKQKILTPEEAVSLLKKSDGNILIEGINTNGKRMYYGIGLNY